MHRGFMNWNLTTKVGDGKGDITDIGNVGEENE
jgi:hypothetical protein